MSITFDFDQFNKKGLKPVIRQFEKNDLQITSVEADNKTRRQAGVQTKKAILNFADGQKLTLQGTALGSIFQVRLNTKVIPVRHVDDLTKAVTEISAMVRKNSGNFQKNLQQKLARATSTRTDTATKARTSLKAQIALAEASNSELGQTLEEARKEKARLEEELPSKQQQQTTIDSQLAEARQLTAQLKAELASLQEKNS